MGISKEEKIKESINNPLFESTNKQYSKIKHSGKITYISIDKKTGATKEFSAARFKSLKKIVKISEPYKDLNLASMRINPDTKGFRTKKHTYKKYKDEKNNRRFAQLDKKGNVIRTYSFKDAIHKFKTFKNEKNIRNLMQVNGWTRKEAKDEFASKQAYLKENQIQGIMAKDEIDRDKATEKWFRLFNYGGMNILLNKYTKFNPSSSYKVIV